MGRGGTTRLRVRTTGESIAGCRSTRRDAYCSARGHAGVHKRRLSMRTRAGEEEGAKQSRSQAPWRLLRVRRRGCAAIPPLTPQQHTRTCARVQHNTAAGRTCSTARLHSASTSTSGAPSGSSAPNLRAATRGRPRPPVHRTTRGNTRVSAYTAARIGMNHLCCTGLRWRPHAATRHPSAAADTCGVRVPRSDSSSMQARAARHTRDRRAHHAPQILQACVHVLLQAIERVCLGSHACQAVQREVTHGGRRTRQNHLRNVTMSSLSALTSLPAPREDCSPSPSPLAEREGTERSDAPVAPRSLLSSPLPAPGRGLNP